MGGERRCRTRLDRDRGRRKKLIAALQWQHKWGAYVKNWQKIHDLGREPPATFYNQPEVADHLNEIWDAFSVLTTERPSGMGIGPIPASKIRQYSREELGLEGEEDDRFYTIMRQVDIDYVAMCNDSSKRPDREAAVEDVDGVKAIFSSLESRGDKRLPGKPSQKN